MPLYLSQISFCIFPVSFYFTSLFPYFPSFISLTSIFHNITLYFHLSSLLSSHLIWYIFVSPSFSLSLNLTSLSKEMDSPASVRYFRLFLDHWWSNMKRRNCWPENSSLHGSRIDPYARSEVEMGREYELVWSLWSFCHPLQREKYRQALWKMYPCKLILQFWFVPLFMCV